MSNQEISKILSEVAALLEMKGVAFKPKAFEKAAFSVGALSERVDEIYKVGGLKALEAIPGVGAGIAGRIEEYIKTGRVKDYDRLKKQFPVDVSGLMNIEGVGPQMIKKLYKTLGVKDVHGLTLAAREGKLRKISGFGEKTEQNILRGIGFMEQSPGRLKLGFVLPLARKILAALEVLPEVKRAEAAGSVRRRQETIGDLDILVVSESPETVMDFFTGMPEVSKVMARGSTKSSVRLEIGMDADLRVVPPESFGAALQYFTGDKYHNVALRQIAVEQGYKLNEYGLFKKDKIVAGETEEEIYEKLGLKWMEPELRTNRGEIEAAQNGGLPELISYSAVRGDLQVHTNWTDGEYTIREMAEAAKKCGLEYLAITDHTKSLAMTGGADEEKLERQMKEIDNIQKEMSGIKILKGAEVNINKDGSLDIEDGALAKLDVVGAAVHSHFNLSEKDMTDRIMAAMRNPHVDILFHPTGRIIGKREGYKINMDEIIKTAKKTGTVLEIDAHPDRLDLNDENTRKAAAEGVKLSIDTDAHSVEHFSYVEFGIAQARRGWCGGGSVINTKGWKEMLGLLKK